MNCAPLTILTLLGILHSLEYVLYFFFSSRRRHTRSLCDWSSDVCSSDLAAFGKHQHAVAVGEAPLVVLRLDVDPLDAGDLRSEERRVGKEWRSRWSPKH